MPAPPSPLPAQPAATPLPEFWTSAEVARVCRVSRRTLHDWVNAGRFPQPVRAGARRFLWSPAAVKRWLEQREGRPHATA